VKTKLVEWGWPRLLWEVGPFKMVDMVLGGPSASNQGICKQLIGIHRYLRFESQLSLSKSVLQVMRGRQDAQRLIAEYDTLAEQAWSEVLFAADQQSPRDENPLLPNWVDRFWLPDWSDEHAWYW
ncbi:MAG TPA: hypothetical protein VMF89_27805, partial [Polyangiales bacterium]|nr:hypothetical protein [Polyangiales bacterium]